jgi:plastocyanin
MTRSAYFGLAFILLASATGAAALAAEPGEVTIDNFSFNPATITVKPGETVTWTNRDDIPHNVRESGGNDFKCGVMDTGEKCTASFKTPGEYKYFCALHPHMVGTVIVKAE